MITVSIEASECFKPCPTAYISPVGVTFVVEAEKVEVCNYGAVNLFGTITDAEAQKDKDVIASRRGEPSEPLDKALRDLGLT